MIYLEETYDLVPASPVTLDQLVVLSQERLVKAYADLGARLVTAWFSDTFQFHRVTHIYELDSLSAYGLFREKSAAGSSFQECQVLLSQLSPVKETRLLEPLFPVWADKLHEAIAESQKAPLQTYFLAVLETHPDRFKDVTDPLADGAGMMPIVGSWRPITGKSNSFIDLWKSTLERKGYQPADENMKDFFANLRASAPTERVEHVLTLPYSPLR